MTDPGLSERRAGADVPALVLWGASHGIVDPDHGRAYAEALPQARLVVLPRAGPVPQIEQPAALAGELTAFLAAA